MDSKHIKAMVLDIDGVLTDGTVSVGGVADKRLFLRDLDALTRLRQSDVQLAYLTGEPEQEAAPVVYRCGGGAYVVYQAKNKEKGIREIADKLAMELSELCYVADARRDVPALQLVGLAMCPVDADPRAKQVAHIVLQNSGGRGAVSEAVDLILEGYQNEGTNE